MMWGIWFIFFLLIIAGIIIFIISASKRTGLKENSSNNALEILKERYVKGEITNEEFNRIKNDII